MRATEMSLGLKILRTSVFVTVIGLAASPVVAQAQTADTDAITTARSHYQAGARLFDQAQYRAAIDEFSAANKIAPSGLLDYNIALCHERLGEVSEALARYRAYLARSTNPTNRIEVERKIARLEQSEQDRLAATNAKPVPNNPASTSANNPASEFPAPSKPSGTGTSQATPTTPTYPPTGDPELDRVAALDLGTVAKRHPGVAPARATTSSSTSSSSRAPTPSTGALPPAKNKNDSDSKPLYKRWWFWVVVAVSTIIVIDIASSGSGEPTRSSRMIYPDMGGALYPSQSGGFTLHF